MDYQGAWDKGLAWDRALLILQLTERPFCGFCLPIGTILAHNAVCVPRLEGHFRDSSEKNLCISAEEMDEELRAEAPLGSFHPPEPRPGQEALAPPDHFLNLGPVSLWHRPVNGQKRCDEGFFQL